MSAGGLTGSGQVGSCSALEGLRLETTKSETSLACGPSWIPRRLSRIQFITSTASRGDGIARGVVGAGRQPSNAVNSSTLGRRGFTAGG